MEFLTGVPGQNVPRSKIYPRIEWLCRIIPRGRERERERGGGGSRLFKERKKMEKLSIVF